MLGGGGREKYKRDKSNTIIQRVPRSCLMLSYKSTWQRNKGKGLVGGGAESKRNVAKLTGRKTKARSRQRKAQIYQHEGTSKWFIIETNHNFFRKTKLKLPQIQLNAGRSLHTISLVCQSTSITGCVRRLVGWLVGRSGNPFFWRSTRRILLAYLALFLRSFVNRFVGW